jgi:hypothetical protein
MTLSIMELNIECCHAECHDFCIIMLNVGILKVVILSDVVLIVVASNIRPRWKCFSNALAYPAKLWRKKFYYIDT